MKVEAMIVFASMTLTAFIVNAPPVRSRLTTPVGRAAASGLLAGAFTAGGLLIERLVFTAH